MSILPNNEVEEHLKNIEGWKISGNEILKTYKKKNFIDSIGFVNKIAILAEKADHHPDILIQYSMVKINLSTHSESGITKKDIDLATEIEKIQ